MDWRLATYTLSVYAGICPEDQCDAQVIAPYKYVIERKVHKDAECAKILIASWLVYLIRNPQHFLWLQLSFYHREISPFGRDDR